MNPMMNPNPAMPPQMGGQPGQMTPEQMRLQQLQQLMRTNPEAARQQIAAMSKDYAGRQAMGADNVAAARQQFNQAMETPAVRPTAPGNPFSVSMGEGPMGAVVRALRGRKARQDLQKAQAGLEGLSEDREGAVQKMMEAGMAAVPGAAGPQSPLERMKALMMQQRMGPA